MLKAVWHEVSVKMSERIAVGDNSGVAELHVARIAVETAIRWLAEQVPTDEQARQIWKEDVTPYYEHYQPVQQIIAAWVRRMFSAPEPEVPEAVKDLLWSKASLLSCENQRILEAYRRGMASR
jgi:hypothetical protein